MKLNCVKTCKNKAKKIEKIENLLICVPGPLDNALKTFS